MSAILFRSGGWEKRGAPVICLLPCLNGTGSLLARTDKAEHKSSKDITTYALGADTSDGILTHDTKLHSVHLDLYFEVLDGPVVEYRRDMAYATRRDEVSKSRTDEGICTIAEYTSV